jgi:hypothetical protein
MEAVIAERLTTFRSFHASHDCFRPRAGTASHGSGRTAHALQKPAASHPAAQSPQETSHG